MTDRVLGTDALEALFDPKSIALVGASDNPLKLGSIALRNLQAGGYAGNIYPVSRRLNQIAGLRCYPTLDALPEPADVAFLTIPAGATPEAVRECAAAGVKVAILGSAGFAESGDEGARLQDELAKIASASGIRLVGPNCNGIYRSTPRLALGFNTAHARTLPAGNVAIVSHSGALFESMASQLVTLGTGLSIFVSTGNEVDLELLDYLEFAIEDPHTKVIALLLDRISGAMKFRRIAARAKSKGKHIVALKIGNTDIGKAAATAHSSRLASDARSYEALFEQANIPTVTTVEALMGAAALLSRYGHVEGGLAAFSTSGAGASLMADLAERHGVPLAEFNEPTTRQISAAQANAVIGNPTDVGVFGGIAPQVPILIAQDPSVGVIAAMMHSMLPSQRTPFLDMIEKARIVSNKPFIAFNPGAFSDEERDDYVKRGFAVLSDSECAMQSLAALLTADRDDAEAIADADGRRPMPCPFGSGRQLSEPESLGVLSQYGIRTVPTIVCCSVDDAVAAARKVGWPIVLKGVVDGVGHKTEHGLVRLDLGDEATLRAAYVQMGSPVTVAVQPMMRGRLEVIAGISRAPDTGPMLVAGLGGIYVDALQDVSMWPIPTTAGEIRRKLSASPLGRVLQSPRWSASRSLESLVTVMLGLQALALDAGDILDTLDVNPLLLLDDGVVAVDALVISSGGHCQTKLA